MGGLNAPLGVEDTITRVAWFDATPFWQGEVSPPLARADGALYVAKRKGRNRLEVAQEFLVQAA
jgi:GGDEF domain-containing protein